MKKYLFLIITIALINVVNAQLPAPYSSGIKVNFVRTWDAMAPITHPDTMLTRPFKDVKQTTAYLDGLGRPLQTVIKKGSMVTGSSAYDFIAPVIYDEFGRETHKFLPFTANTTGSNTSLDDGYFKLNAFQQDSAFNKGIFSDETYYYNKAVFEASPLNRTLESFAAGNNWVGTAGDGTEANRRGMKMKYWINTVADSVRIWNVTDVSNDFGTYATSGIYALGTLYKDITQDEHNKQVIQFTDKNGKVILKKVQLTASNDDGTGLNHTGWLCTYFIYDYLGNLRCVVQPKGVELLAANSWSMSYSSGIIMNEQCFRYEYDSRKRMIMKKVPGTNEVYMVYDLRDRLVMMQDANMRADDKWMVTKYDILNRPSETGIWESATSFTSHQSSASASSSYPTTSSNYEQMTKTFYDDYTWRSGESNPLSASREDDYDSYLLTPSNSWPYAQDATTPTAQLTGMVTGTKTRILETNDFLYSIPFYDDKARVIQTQSTNITTGTDIANIQYSWSGQPLLSINKNQKGGTNADTTIVLTKITYDDLWRPIKTEKKISSTKVYNTSVFSTTTGVMPGSWTTMSTNEYNALGQPKKKELGNDPVETLNYDYNIRGWTLGMNRNYVKDTTSTSNWFGYDLGYDKTSFTVNSGNHSYSAAQYNGNINGMLWRSTGDDMLRKYDFTYDAANRFMSADFNQLNSNAFSKAAGVNFSVSGMSYDANGNIGTMNQKGWKLGGSVTIDSLAYTYITNTNKLLKVIDAVTTNNKLGDFNDGGNGSNDDYDYDDNGNLITDSNKKITGNGGGDGIQYNHLNLPKLINIDIKGFISYVYDANGTKLEKSVYDDSLDLTTTTLYLNGAVYENNKLQFLGTEEGRARINADSSEMVYDYMVKDHLGNVRMVLTAEQKTDMYPAATMEEATETEEEAIYANLDATREDLPTDYPACVGLGCGFDPNDKVAKVNGGGNKIGPAMILKVMAGDKFNVSATSWWKSNNSPNTPVSPLSDLITAISGSAAGASGGHFSSGDLSGSAELSASTTNFLNSQSYPSNGKPKAYVNWVLFDQRFNYVSSSSGFEQVGASDAMTSHAQTDLPVDKSGYLYVYVSNATDNIDVYFDKLQVTHTRGPLVQEDHYYPWGLTMNGISSKALSFGGAENKYKFNAGTEFSNKEFSDGSGLDWYDTEFRRYDAQIGRFTGIDALSSLAPNQSGYSFVQNNPILFVDPQGLDTVRVSGGGSHKIKIGQGDVLAWTIGKVTSYYTYDPTNSNAVNGFVGEGIRNDQLLPEATIVTKHKSVTASTLKDQISWGLDASFSMSETSRATFRMTNGINNGNTFSPKWYSPSTITGRGWGGGSKAGITTYKISSMAKTASWTLFGVGIITDGVGVYKYYTAPTNTSPDAFIQPVHPAKAGLNTGIGLYSLKVNPIAGALYFGVEAFYPGGWRGYANNYESLQKQNAAIVPGFITAPYGALKQ